MYRDVSDNLGTVIKLVDISTGTIAQELTNNSIDARDYNPETGRRIKKNPIGFTCGDVDILDPKISSNN